MASEPDVGATAPTLILRLADAGRLVTLRCTGTLDGTTCGHVLEAVDGVLAGGPSHVDIDVSDLRVADVDGAHALARVQRAVREAGAVLQWRGLEPERVKGFLTVRYRARRRASSLGGPGSRRRR